VATSQGVVPHHGEFEYVALIRTGLGSKCAVERSHGYPARQCSTCGSVANVAVHQIVVVAVIIRSAGTGVQAALTGRRAYNCTCDSVKNGVRTKRQLECLA